MERTTKNSQISQQAVHFRTRKGCGLKKARRPTYLGEDDVLESTRLFDELLAPWSITDEKVLFTRKGQGRESVDLWLWRRDGESKNRP
jgi:hypothetical protein